MKGTQKDFNESFKKGPFLALPLLVGLLVRRRRGLVNGCHAIRDRTISRHTDTEPGNKRTSTAPEKSGTASKMLSKPLTILISA